MRILIVVLLVFGVVQAYCGRLNLTPKQEAAFDVEVLRLINMLKSTALSRSYGSAKSMPVAIGVWKCPHVLEKQKDVISFIKAIYKEIEKIDAWDEKGADSREVSESRQQLILRLKREMFDPHGSGRKSKLVSLEREGEEEEEAGNFSDEDPCGFFGEMDF